LVSTERCAARKEKLRQTAKTDQFRTTVAACTVEQSKSVAPYR